MSTTPIQQRKALIQKVILHAMTYTRIHPGFAVVTLSKTGQVNWWYNADPDPTNYLLAEIKNGHVINSYDPPEIQTP